MKIGIMGTRGIPNNYGGFEQFTEYIAVGLKERGHDVHVYSSLNHPYQQNEWNGVKIIHCKDPENKYGTFGQFFYDLHCIRDARNRDFDILFHFGYSSDSVWWRRWPKHMIHIMNMDGLEWKRTKYNFLTRRFLKWAESLAARKPQALIADSIAMQEHILKKYRRHAVFIPYHAREFTGGDPAIVVSYGLDPHQYFLAIARMEPENNIELIIRGFLEANPVQPLVLIGSTSNRFGKYLAKKYRDDRIRFLGPIYDPSIINNLRRYSFIYFHGHSVGGTNPSLLEAMACGCRIASHDNEFNRGVLGPEAMYFKSTDDIRTIVGDPRWNEEWREKNLDKIRDIYNPVRILDAYEALMADTSRQTAGNNS